jgi:DNA-directed RNA polymerase I subunit RPA12
MINLVYREDRIDFNKIFERPPNFCPECGDLLDFELIVNDMVICQKCGGEMCISNITNHHIETSDEYTTSKDWVNKLKNVEDKFKVRHKLKRSVIDERCIQCGHGQMYYWTQQLRSADEGSTVFYQCVKCGVTKKENN